MFLSALPFRVCPVGATHTDSVASDRVKDAEGEGGDFFIFFVKKMEKYYLFLDASGKRRSIMRSAPAFTPFGAWRGFLSEKFKTYVLQLRTVKGMRAHYIEKSTVDALRRVIGREEWLPMQISIETGLRIGDVVALRLENVVTRDKVHGIAYKASKTGKEGFAPISDGLYKRLRGRKGFLFKGTGKSGHLTRQACWARMKRGADRLKIDSDGISPHSLRKCFAVALMHERGITAVREALQHSNDAVTRVYAYADTLMRADSDAPIRWRECEILVDYILARLNERS